MIESLIKEKKIASSLSVVSNTSLIVLKIIAGVVSGSIGIISEALHSASDLVASVITYFSVCESSKPADDDHQFGHGKYEDFAGYIEGSLIIFAAIYIIYEAVKKILNPPSFEMDVTLGLWVMGFSAFVNILISAYLFKVAKKTDSAALFADGEHLRTDVYSSLAVLGGLFFVKLTGNYIYDPIIAMVVAVIIFNAGFQICEKSRKNLLDISLSEDETNMIKTIVEEHQSNGIISLVNVRTRRAGGRKTIELTLTVDGSMHISTAHSLCDKIEAEIDEKLKNTDTTIHLEPS